MKIPQLISLLFHIKVFCSALSVKVEPKVKEFKKFSSSNSSVIGQKTRDPDILLESLEETGIGTECHLSS